MISTVGKSLILNGDILELWQELPEVDLIYIDPPFFTQRDFGEFDDRWGTIDDYILSLMERIECGWGLLRDGGALLVHVDWRASHYLKVALDSIAGAVFQNEIIWKYNSGGASKRRLSRKHDTIFWYTKGDDYTFNQKREPYPHQYSGSGFHPEGKLLSDVWTDIGFIGTSSSERTGYPTQKPEKLLQRLIELFSNTGDVVLDFYCGSGTTGVVASSLDRNSIMIDVNPNAVAITKDRINDISR